MFLSDHWKNFRKVNKDRIYINNVYEKLLKIISKKLNQEFRLKKPLIFWRIIIGPWLIFYLVSNFNKWQLVKYKKRQILKELKKFNIKNHSNLINYDINDFYKKARENDSYNNICLYRIINPKKININNINLEFRNYKKKEITSNTKAIHLLDYFFSFISLVFSKYLIDIQYFPKKVLLKLFLHTKILPSLHRLNINDFTKKNLTFKKKERLNLFDLDKNNNFDSFEKFIFSCLPTDFPIQYFENFKLNMKKISFLSSFPKKIIITMISHMFNEKFKFYLAEMVSNNCKLVVIEHGGCLDYKFDSFFNHEDKICFKKITWDKSKGSKKIQLPVIQLLPNKTNINKKKDDKILILFCEILKFPMKIQCLPYNSHRYQEVYNLKNILKRINKNYHTKINFRYSSSMNENNNSVINSLKKKFPKVNFYNYKKGPSLEEDLSRSQIVICTNPETTLAQSIISKRPTLLYLDKKHYKFSNKSNLMLRNLKKEKIYFDNFNSLAEHINNLLKNSKNKWFYSPNVKKAYKLFEKNFFNVEINWLDKWKKFLVNLC